MQVISIGQPPEVADLLAGHDMNVHIATDSIAGTRRIISHQPDLAIVNVDMPRFSGLGVGRVLNLLKVPVPIIFTAASPEKSESAKALENFADFVNKDRLSEFLDAGYFKEMCKRNKELRETMARDTPCVMSPGEWANLMARPGRKRILIVEDDPISRKLLTMLLGSPDDVELYTAENGLEGIFKAMLVRPNLILTDLSMPVVDGLTMSQIMYLLGKPYPIVFLTATADSAMVKKAAKLGSVIGYLIKGEMGNKIMLIRAIDRYLKEAEEIEKASRKTSHEANLETLISSSAENGGLVF